MPASFGIFRPPKASMLLPNAMEYSYTSWLLSRLEWTRATASTLPDQKRRHSAELQTAAAVPAQDSNSRPPERRCPAPEYGRLAAARTVAGQDSVGLFRRRANRGAANQISDWLATAWLFAVQPVTDVAAADRADGHLHHFEKRKPTAHTGAHGGRRCCRWLHCQRAWRRRGDNRGSGAAAQHFHHDDAGDGAGGDGEGTIGVRRRGGRRRRRRRRSGGSLLREGRYGRQQQRRYHDGTKTHGFPSPLLPGRSRLAVSGP